MTAGLPPRALERAQRLACVVHGDGGPKEVAALLEPLGRDDLYALAVTLAALVDIDRSVAELLAWYTGSTRQERDFNLAPHGTHAAYTRHKSRGEEPCWDCVEGQRAYDRDRARRRRAAARPILKAVG